MNQTDTKETKLYCFTERICSLSLCRLKIPPFVSARTALEGHESEDLNENEKPVKTEITARKVKVRVRSLSQRSHPHYHHLFYNTSIFCTEGLPHS